MWAQERTGRRELDTDSVVYVNSSRVKKLTHLDSKIDDTRKIRSKNIEQFELRRAQS